MNANELANELERPNNYQQENNFTTQAATMLRQQQDEIEALKAEREIMFGFVKSRGEVGQLIMYKASQEQNQ